MDWTALKITVQLAAATSCILLCLCCPLAWYIGRRRAPLWRAVDLVATLPLALPPTALGFLLLALFQPESPGGWLWVHTMGQPFAFSFAGIVVASVVASLPFALHPLLLAVRRFDPTPVEVAATLGLGRWRCWAYIIIPALSPAVFLSFTLSFMHTLGEFGVILTVGGGLPGETRVLSVALYEQVENIQFAEAYTTTLLLLAVSVASVLALQMGQTALARPHT